MFKQIRQWLFTFWVMSGMVIFHPIVTVKAVHDVLKNMLEDGL